MQSITASHALQNKSSLDEVSEMMEYLRNRTAEFDRPTTLLEASSSFERYVQTTDKFSQQIMIG